MSIANWQKIAVLAVLIIAVEYFYSAGYEFHATSFSSKVPMKSVFEEYVDMDGGSVTFPFESLHRKLHIRNSIDSHQSPTLFILIPFGRSLQKDLTDYKEPRIVTFTGLKTPVYVGYAPRANQLEVISWNKHTDEFDFLIVPDYRKGARPHPVRMDRNFCMQCHQHGGPIFPRAPWREMTTEDFFSTAPHTKLYNGLAINSLVDKIIQARNGETMYNGLNLNDYRVEINYFHNSDDTPFFPVFDDVVRLSAARIQLKRAFKNICGSDLECRRSLIKIALLYPTDYFYSNAINPEYDDTVLKIFKSLPQNYEQHLKEIQNIVSMSWANDGFGYPSSVLPDRERLDNGQERGFLVQPKESGNPLSSTFDESHVTQLPAEVEMKPDEMYLLDPKTPRPLIHAIEKNNAPYYIITLANQAFNFSDADREVLNSLDKSKMEIAIGQKNFLSTLKDWPPNLSLVMATLLTNMGETNLAKSYWDSYKNYDETMLQSNLTELKLSEIPAADGDRNLFVQYCSRCHAKHDSFAPYLPLTDITQLSQNKYIRDFVSKEKRIMPLPIEGIPQPSDVERDKMRELLGPAPK